MATGKMEGSIKMFGAYSSPYVAMQGIIAGCSMATSLLRALLFRSIVRLAANYSMLRFKVLVDDVSLQWVGLRNQFHRVVCLTAAVRHMLAVFQALGMVAQLAKCGLVLSSFAEWLLELFNIPFSLQVASRCSMNS